MTDAYAITRAYAAQLERRLAALESLRFPGGDSSLRPVYRKRCVVIGPVVSDADHLLVQEVRYKQTIPVPCPDATSVCDVEVIGQPFKAWPEYPAQISDFDGLDVRQGDTLKADKPAVTAWLMDGKRWLIEKPATSSTPVRTVVILASRTLGGPVPTTGTNPGPGVSTLEEFELLVQEITVNDDTAQYELKGDAFVANTFPNVAASAYHVYIGRGRNVPTSANAMFRHVVKSLGVWTVIQTPNFRANEPPSGTAGSCSTTATN